MLTFLRKTRKTLIESGASRRYLLYAVGEIMLVMIGILLALQVNNLNEQRKDKIKELDTIKLILRDLKEDSDNLKFYSYQLKEQEKAVIYVLKELDQISNPDSLEHYAFFALSSYNYRPSFSTFQGLKQNGNLDLIKDQEVLEEIIEFYDEVMPYLDDLRSKYLRLTVDANNLMLPYFGYQLDESAKWKLKVTENIGDLKTGINAKNALSAAGQIRNWLDLRINTIFLDENLQLQKILEGYIFRF